MKARLTLLATLAVSIWLIYAVPALAHDNGEGLVGETDDRIITFFSLGLVVFFTAFVCLASWLQAALERRKEERKATELRRLVGW
jgi:bacteriorhodopsin